MSSPTGPACLNRQILILLSCLGVSTSAVLAIASEAISVLSSCCTDADSARIAVQYLRVGKLETLLRQLIACGVWDEPFVLQQLKGTAESTGMLSAIGAQAHIPVLRSRRVMIISDPTGLLKVCHCVVLFYDIVALL